MSNFLIRTGCYSFLLPLTDNEILLQVESALAKNWLIGIDYTDEMSIQNTQWIRWRVPLTKMQNAEDVLVEITKCRYQRWREYIRVVFYNPQIDVQSVALTFLVNRPWELEGVEPGFRITRFENKGCHLQYTLTSYAVDHRPIWYRY